MGAGATYYGLGEWSIHTGACGLGYQYKNVGTGWDVAAVADASPEFQGSCGRCYEVRCDPRAPLIDGEDHAFDRSSVCKEGAASVVVRTVDACPCEYPANAYSNKRWCCGDHSDTQGTHFDMSVWSFEKLADTKWGVAGVQFRRVPCTHVPVQPAPEGATDMPPEQPPQALGFPGTCYEAPPYFPEQKLVVRFDQKGLEQGAVRPKGSYNEEGAQVLTQGQILLRGAAAGGPSEAGQAYGKCDSPWMLAGNYCAATCGRCPAGEGASAPAAAPAAPVAETEAAAPAPACADVPPPETDMSCAEQKTYGKCDSPWMVSGNYCAATCGRCPAGDGAAASAAAPAVPPTAGPAAPPADACSDVPPPGSTLSCADQKAAGKCDSPWMLAGSYCAATCGHCPAGDGAAAPAAAPAAPVTETVAAAPAPACADVPPPETDMSCAEQKAAGKCDSPWMVSGNYCAATCSRCPAGDGAAALAAAPAVPPTAGPAAPPADACSDVPPPGSTLSCAEQKAAGKCDSPWMVSGNHCTATCGRCTPAGDGAAAPAPTAAPAESPAPAAPDAGAASTDCSDVPPPESTMSCSEQKSSGKCESAWMTAGNYCAATCGRCSPAAAAASPSPPPAASPAPAAAPDGTAGAPAPATPGAGCSDVPAPPEAADVVSPVPLSCAEQKAFGKCATFYGVDGWSIHKGSCGFGYQYKNVGTGWDAAAVSDASPEFAGSCGRCYEVRCAPRQVIDGYGNTYDRSGACKAGAASIVVRTVDACPCQYPSNAYSNKRWCCGDHSDTQGTHFDLSIWAFEKLADTNNGMAGVQFRPVPCDHVPAQRAPDGPTAMPPSEQPKVGGAEAQCLDALGYPGTAIDPPGGFLQQPLVVRFDDTGKEQGAVRPMKSFDGSGVQVVTQGQVLEADTTAVAASAASSASQPSASADASAQASSDNGCTDAPPAGSTCAKQKSDGNCGQPWLLSGNYCRATCGRCALGGAGTASSAGAAAAKSHASAGAGATATAAARAGGGQAQAQAKAVSGRMKAFFGN
ncbi:U6 snRNA phosphodiesterase [Micractinium conductrix]|uniref:U6 snRNA phosphodiesterase n=1 Tax=Micractinium conductrix TaxID=554055 RepID=A0A2P6V0R8_9CHLO|nr:U6 snRNA phosphodiesterase [Micractinium conductrix]|eukprot:PSC67673.1 U6 snRNA phosphodiesterase [Micractinium conductrix]